MPLPRKFLTQIARDYDLSPEQEQTFVLLLGTDKTKLEICQQLYISDSSFRSRMTGVYKKFSISGSGPVKERKLLKFLTTEYHKFKASDSPNFNLSEDELNDLVQEVRSYCHKMIQYQCGTMRSLTLSQPIDVSDLYTNVNILERITSHRRREIDELVQDCNPENGDRFGLGRVTETIPGLEAVEKYSKLMVLGKPGSGKTTFLKHLAIQCNQGKFQAHRVPTLLALKPFAEAEGQPSLLEYITQMFSDCNVSADQIAVLLKHGKTLVLLDGLDEVKVEDNSRVMKQVRDFSDKFRTNQFVITCRIAASSYTFDKFTEVEVADFDEEQIDTFAQKWFQNKEPAKAEEFIQQLQENDQIRELATNPLLLTLLCLVFEKSAKFPANRSELYEEGVDILLRRWDETQKIEREQVYKNLSLQRKKDLLSQIALTTFERGDYFFKQKQLEQYISDYIRNLPDGHNDLEALQLDSEAVLKSIEAQHGLLVERAHKIYSFSHLTFQEYFIAREAIAISETEEWQSFLKHITDKRWHEVFLLTVEMVNNADYLLLSMKQQVEGIIAQNEKLQQFLIWVYQKSLSVKVNYHLTDIRLFYLKFFAGLNLWQVSVNQFQPLCSSIFVEENFDIDSNFSLWMARSFSSSLASYNEGTILGIRGKLITLILTESDFFSALVPEVPTELKQAFQKLKDQLPPQDATEGIDADDELDINEEILDRWWQANGQAWNEQLKAILNSNYNISHNWQFNDSEKELLMQYLDANCLLVNCLNMGCEVSSKVREEMEETLFLPKDEIGKWKQQHRPSV